MAVKTSEAAEAIVAIWAVESKRVSVQAVTAAQTKSIVVVAVTGKSTITAVVAAKTKGAWALLDAPDRGIISTVKASEALHGRHCSTSYGKTAASGTCSRARANWSRSASRVCSWPYAKTAWSGTAAWNETVAWSETAAWRSVSTEGAAECRSARGRAVTEVSTSINMAGAEMRWQPTVAEAVTLLPAEGTEAGGSSSRGAT